MRLLLSLPFLSVLSQASVLPSNLTSPSDNATSLNQKGSIKLPGDPFDPRFSIYPLSFEYPITRISALVNLVGLAIVFALSDGHDVITEEVIVSEPPWDDALIKVIPDGRLERRHVMWGIYYAMKWLVQNRCVSSWIALKWDGNTVGVIEISTSSRRRLDDAVNGTSDETSQWTTNRTSHALTRTRPGNITNDLESAELNIDPFYAGGDPLGDGPIFLSLAYAMCLVSRAGATSPIPTDGFDVRVYATPTYDVVLAVTVSDERRPPPHRFDYRILAIASWRIAKWLADNNRYDSWLCRVELDDVWVGYIGGVQSDPITSPGRVETS